MHLHTRLMLLGALLNLAAALAGFGAVLWLGLEPWAAVALFLAVSFLVDIPLAWIANRRRPVTGLEAMLGDTAVVESGFDDHLAQSGGRVRWRNELWDASLVGSGGVRPGDRVIIVGNRGLRLEVRLHGPESC